MSERYFSSYDGKTVMADVDVNGNSLELTIEDDKVKAIGNIPVGGGGDESVWTDETFNALADDNDGDDIQDENDEVIGDEDTETLWVTRNGIEFKAKRADADADGNNIAETYAKKDDIIPPIKDGGMLPDTASVTVENNARSFVSTTKAALTIIVNIKETEIPNFAIEIRSSQQTGITVKAVTPKSQSVLKYSDAGGNLIEANKDYQLTCVGSCWTLAEFKRPSDATYDFGAVTITFDNDVGSISIDNSGNYIHITEPILVEHFNYNRVFEPGIPATIVFPFQLDDASKITSGHLYEIEDIVYEKPNFSAILSSSPVTSVQPNYPYIYIPESASLTISLDTNEQLLIVPTVDPTITIEATSGTWLMHGTYQYTRIGDLPNFDADDLRYYGYAAQSEGQVHAGDFVRASGNATLPLMRAYFERTFDLPSNS